MLIQALNEALAERDRSEAEAWTVERELLATLVEVTHALLIVTLKAHGAKNPGKPLRVPRPDAVGDARDEPVSASQFAAMMR